MPNKEGVEEIQKYGVTAKEEVEGRLPQIFPRSIILIMLTKLCNLEFSRMGCIGKFD